MEIAKPVRMHLSDQLIAGIEEQIKSGNWKVGEKIPGELELMKMFGVSRNTIRETLKPLVYVGILQAKQGDGTYIVASNALAASLSKRFLSAQYAELLEVRYALETQIVRFAALRRSEEELALLEISLVRRNSPGLNAVEIVDADTDFHSIIAEMSHNTLLCDLYGTLISSLDSFKQHYLQLSNYEQQNSQHSKLFEAIRDSDPDRAEQAAAELITLGRESLEA